MSVEIIYDDEELSVFWSPRSSQIVVITFCDLISPASNDHFFADEPLRKLDISAIGVVAKRGNWYPAENIAKACKSIFKHIAGYEIRMMYGGSMGGYAAIKFSRLFGATHVIALCPQWSIDPGECQGIDPGWADYVIPTMRGMGIRPHDIAGEVFIFADGFDARDKFHCRMIIENHPGAHFINVPMVEHHVTSVFAGSGNLQELISACGVGDMTELRKISRRTRKSHWVWKDHCLSHAMRKLPRIGMRYLLHPDNHDQLRNNWRYFPSVLSHLAQTVGAGQAIAFYNRSWSLLPGPFEQHLICACLASVAGGRVAIATTHASWLIYDLLENRVIHKASPLGPWDIPVEAELRSSGSALFVMVGGTRFHLSVSDDGWLDVADSKPRQDERFHFEIKLAENGKFTIGQDRKYLSAGLAEVVICDREIANDWEMFHFGSLEAAAAIEDNAEN